jgi:hypothetical protein
MYKAIFDIGKPYEETINNDTDLRKALKVFYEQSLKDDNDLYDVQIFNSENEDISESQFITEMIFEIMEEVGGENNEH